MTDDLDAGLWLSISDIARDKGKTRQAIAKRVDALVETGKLETKPGPNGTKLVNVAQFDLAVGEVGDAVKESAAETVKDNASDDTPAAPALRDAQTRQAQYSADLKYLELNERLGKLLPVEQVEDAATTAIEAIARVVDRMPSHGEAIAAAVGKDGTNGARSMLKELAREIRAMAADAFAALGGKDRGDVSNAACFDDRDLWQPDDHQADHAE